MKEIEPINKSLKKFEKWLYGFNYECHFVFERICDSLDIRLARELINKKFELTWQTEKVLIPIEYEEFLNDISEKLLYRGDYGSGVKLTDREETEFRIELKKLKELIKQNFDPTRTEIFIHPEIFTWIFWGFCFLIVSKERNEIYLFEGLSSD